MLGLRKYQRHNLTTAVDMQVHFEESQFEKCSIFTSHRKLKPNAIPTLFNIPNPPRMLTSKRRILKRSSSAVNTITEIAGSSKKIRIHNEHTYVHSKEKIYGTPKIRQKIKCITNDHDYSRSFITTSVTIDGNNNKLTNKQPANDHEMLLSTNDVEPINLQETEIVSEYNTIAHSMNITLLRNKLADEKLKTRRQALELASLKRKLATTNASLTKLFNSDQIEHLNGDRRYPWSSETIKKGLQMTTLMGKNGYEYLRTSVGYLVPSYRTICERVENVPMAPGILTDLMELLHQKTETMTDDDKDCVLIVDEVQLNVKVEYDKGLKKLVGFVSPQFQPAKATNELAEHALVFMVKGIRTPYKQTVAWYLTGKGTTGHKLWQIAKYIIEELNSHSLRVRAVTSDMGTSNTGMWKSAGLNIDDINSPCFVQHPCNSSHKLYFMADVPHLLKSLRNCLENQQIVLPEDLATKYGLASRTVSMEHVMSVVCIQEFFELKLVPGLSRANIHPGQYGKMKVGRSTKVFSHTMASVLQDLVNNGIIPETAEAMAWFCDALNNWFDIMSNREYRLALYSIANSNPLEPTISH